MNRIIALILILVSLCVPISALAVGEGNVDSGGGSMGTGTSENMWIPGEEGVRVTVIRCSDNAVVSHSFDLTNINVTDMVYNLGIYSKIAYRNGLSLTLQYGNYGVVRPTLSMPKIISSGSGTSSIAEIKRYFCSEYAVMLIASQVGIEYETLISGNYKILIEPVAYFRYGGKYFAVSATQAAMYDKILSGALRSKMVSLTHKNLPFAMFLERPDLGYVAWDGATNKAVSNDTIINYLGLGIVKFTEDSIYEETEQNGNYSGNRVNEYDYRTDTDVITAITINADREYNPDSPLTVKFKVGRDTYLVKNIVIPEDESQLVWIKWHTPSDEQEISITATAGTKKYSLVAKITNLADNEPPDPKANDRNDAFILPDIPTERQVQSLSWGVWTAKWHAHWVWESDWRWRGSRWVDYGQWVDNGWYDFTYNSYFASLTVSQTISPDSKVPTAAQTRMKSGYGFETKVTANTLSDAPYSSYTQAQNSVMYFPEFKYQTYFRVLDKTVKAYSSAFVFKENKYSTYNSRAHFTPVWYPDGTYRVYTKTFDAWTPAGMLSVSTTPSLTIKDNLFDDWHIAPKEV